MNRAWWLGCQKSDRPLGIFVCDFLHFASAEPGLLRFPCSAGKPTCEHPLPLPPDGELLSHVPTWCSTQAVYIFTRFFNAKSSVPLFVRHRCIWQLQRFCWKWAVLCSAQTHLASCVHTAYVKQIFWLHDWKYTETTCVPKRVWQVLLCRGCWSYCRRVLIRAVCRQLYDVGHR